MAFPLMAPIDAHGELYAGFLTVHGVDYQVEVHLPKSTERQASICTTPDIQRLLRPHKELILKRLRQCERDITVFLNDLRDVLERVLDPTPSATAATYPVERQVALIADLEQIGFDAIKTMNDRMDDITFTVKDSSNRAHSVQVSIPGNYPFMPPKLVTVGIPVSTPAWASSAQSLPMILQDYVQDLHQYQDFFDCMDEVDRETRVLDPEAPSHRDTWRRIALGDHCSVHIDVDPTAPRDIPRINFFGNAKKVSRLKESWLSGSNSTWDTSDSLYHNLKRLLSLPSASEQTERGEQADTADMECGICYAYKLVDEAQDQQTPDVICPNDRCSRGFHPGCLYEWLRSNPSTTRSFNVLFGKCPYCNESITTKMVL